MNDSVWRALIGFRRRLLGDLREQLALMEFTRRYPELVELGRVLAQKRGCRR